MNKTGQEFVICWSLKKDHVKPQNLWINYSEHDPQQCPSKDELNLLNSPISTRNPCQVICLYWLLTDFWINQNRATLEIYITSLKEEIRTYLFWDCPKLDKFFFCDGPTMPITKGKTKNLGVITTNYELWLIIYSMPKIIGTYGNKLLPKLFLIIFFFSI